MCNPCHNYMHITGYPVQHGDSPHFLWGKHLQCRFFQSVFNPTGNSQMRDQFESYFIKPQVLIVRLNNSLMKKNYRNFSNQRFLTFVFVLMWFWFKKKWSCFHLKNQTKLNFIFWGLQLLNQILTLYQPQ
jgi:hypothetical protein